MKVGILRYSYKINLYESDEDTEEEINTILEREGIDSGSIISIIPSYLEDITCGIIYYRKGM